MRMHRAVFLFSLVLPAMGGAGPIGPDALDRLPAADVVILGEIHDNPLHHANQARAVAALAPRALVFEMLTEAQAARVTPQVRGDAAALGALLGWDAAGWPDFAMYHPIFAAAPDAPVFGAAIPREVLQGARTTDDLLALLPGADRFGLDDPLPPADQAAREAEQREAHCNALPAAMLPYMVTVQRLRDAALAAAVLKAQAATGGPVAIITGTGHARRDTGLPAALALAAPDLRVLSVGQMEDDPGPDAPFDLWLVTDPAPREDPCAGFAAP